MKIGTIPPPFIWRVGIIPIRYSWYCMPFYGLTINPRVVREETKSNPKTSVTKP